MPRRVRTVLLHVIHAWSTNDLAPQQPQTTHGLSLYRYNVQTTNDLLTVFERLEDRLVVPHQAVREFHRNRLTAIGNPDGAAQEVRKALQKNQRSTIDALSRWARQVALADAELERLLAQLTAVFDGLLEAVGKAEPDRIQADTPRPRTGF